MFRRHSVIFMALSLLVCACVDIFAEPIEPKTIQANTAGQPPDKDLAPLVGEWTTVREVKGGFHIPGRRIEIQDR